MKIAIPSLGEKGLADSVCPHFGRAPTYTIVDTESGDVDVVENKSEHFGGHGKPPEFLQAKDVHVVLAAGMGFRAMQMFAGHGITVYCGAEGSVQQALTDYENGRLQKASEDTSCKHHHDH